MRMFGGNRFQLSREIILPLVRVHAALEQLQHVYTLGGLRGGSVSIGQFEKSLSSRVFLTQELFENFARPIEISSPNERVAESLEKHGIALGGRKGLKQRGRFRRFVAPQFGLRIQQGDAPFLRRQFVRAP